MQRGISSGLLIPAAKGLTSGTQLQRLAALMVWEAVQ
jgi:hypothetical protein